MKVLVTGGTGTLGRALVDALARAGHEVWAVSRSVPPEGQTHAPHARSAVHWVAGDVRDRGLARQLVANVDGIIHAAQLRSAPGQSARDREDEVHRADRDMVDALAEASLAQQTPRFVIYTSGTWSYGDHPATWIDESTPCRPAYAGRGHVQVGERLQMLHRERGLPVTIMMPGLLYGAIPSFSQWFMQPLRAGQLRLPAPGDNYWSLVHIDDVAEAYVRALHVTHDGHRFNIVDDEPMTMRALFERCAELLGCAPPQYISCEQAAAELGETLAESLALSTRVSNAAARAALDWAPRHPSAHAALPSVIAQIVSRQSTEVAP